MVLKFSKALWFLSILGVLTALLFVYASLSDILFFQIGADSMQVGREPFFYVSLAVITLINALVFVVSALLKKNEAFRTWFNGLVVVLNIFFMITLFLISAINSNEKFDFS